MNPIGYYVSCDDAICEDCAPEPVKGVTWIVPGFMGGEPIPIYRDTEADTPTHCCECGDLIPHALTREGYAYVLERALSHAADSTGVKCPRPNGSLVAGHGTLAEWWNKYSDGIVGIRNLKRRMVATHFGA
jgi:hypothetical protein